jgi:hypothetical protein
MMYMMMMMMMMMMMDVHDGGELELNREIM